MVGMKRSSWLAILLTAACTAGQAVSEGESITPGEPFRVAVGEAALLPEADLTVRFIRVVGDSRCPRDVTCIWEGNAEIEVVLARDTAEVSVRLHTQGRGRHASRGSALGFTVSMESLDPYPSTAEPISPEDYVATLVVTRG